jgi:putative hemolysin
VNLPTEDFETFNGLVFGALGTIPDDGSCVEVETDGLVIKVTDIREHQVEGAIVGII